MKKKKVKIKVRTLVVFAITIMLFGYLSYSGIYYLVFKKNYESEKIVLQNKLNNLKDKETDLNSEINKLKDDDDLARYAREEYLYSKKGEYVIRIEEKKEEEKGTTSTANKFSYKYLYMIIPVFIILLIFIFKKKVKIVK